jgi:hypothetical protein
MSKRKYDAKNKNIPARARKTAFLISLSIKRRFFFEKGSITREFLLSKE